MNAFITVTTLFFTWGFITSMIDPLIPSVRAIFSLNYTESLLTQALRHRLKIMAWPNSSEVPHWQEETTLFQMGAARAFQGSMRQRFDLALIYRRARHRFPKQIDGQPPLPLPETCPVTLDELMTAL